MLEGHAMDGGFFATPKSEFDRIKNKGAEPHWLLKKPEIAHWSRASIIAAVLGTEWQPCTELVVVHFRAEKNEVRQPTKEDAGSDPNWKPGGKTQNLITHSTADGVYEVVVTRLGADRIEEVEYIGHVDYNRSRGEQKG